MTKRILHSHIFDIVSKVATTAISQKIFEPDSRIPESRELFPGLFLNSTYINWVPQLMASVVHLNMRTLFNVSNKISVFT